MESYYPHVESLKICVFKLKPHGFYGTCFFFLQSKRSNYFCLDIPFSKPGLASPAEKRRIKIAEHCCRRTQEKDLTLQHNRVKVSHNRCLSIGSRFLEWSFNGPSNVFLFAFSDDIQHPRCPMYDEFNYTY